jgi:uncharacterized membrane protein
MLMSGFGRVLFGISVAGLAVLSLIYGSFAPILEPFPASLPGREILAYGSGAILLTAGVGLFFVRTASVSAIVIAVYGSVWTLARARALLLEPLSVGTWYGIGEAMGPLVAVWILYALLRRQNAAPAETVLAGDRALRTARVLFGAACILYGASHFAYAAYTAAMVPAWLPGRTGLAYLTGAAHAAAGVGLLTGVLPYLAAMSEAIMMSLFGALVWLPSFFAQPVPSWASSPQTRWSETLLSFLLAASAFIVAASLRDNPDRRSGPARRSL